MTDALKSAGCKKIFKEKASGAQRDRPELKAALDYIRAGDTLVVWKLDRLARSLKQLTETVEDMEKRKGVSFSSSRTLHGHHGSKSSFLHRKTISVTLG